VSDDGKVPRDTVLAVLKARGIDLSAPSHQPNDQFDKTTFAKGIDPGSTLKTYALPDLVGRRMLQHLARVYGVPIHYFYNPSMVLPNEPAADPLPQNLPFTPKAKEKDGAS
jgi:hypothetical protein